jgi:hypothetical protein
MEQVCNRLGLDHLITVRHIQDNGSGTSNYKEYSFDWNNQDDLVALGYRTSSKSCSI